MSHRRWRQNVAPGVSPGYQMPLDLGSPGGATDISVALFEGFETLTLSHPGLTPGAINMPPARAGSSSFSTLAASLKGPESAIIASRDGLFLWRKHEYLSHRLIMAPLPTLVRALSTRLIATGPTLPKPP